MSVATRGAIRALYRDFYDLIPLFSSFCVRTTTSAVPRCRRVKASRWISNTVARRLDMEAHRRGSIYESPSDLSNSPTEEAASKLEYQRQLPHACPGCGALAQYVHPKEAGYYSTQRAAVRKYLGMSQARDSRGKGEEDDVVRNALANVPEELREQLGLDATLLSDKAPAECPSIPVCDRCHHLIHHHAGVPIAHPSLDAIEATIAESPFKHNHIYHVIDAADFPMSFIPGLHRRLDLGWLRGRNRRSKTQHWSGGKSGQMSFLITRADLLAPKKEQVDGLLPQLREILRSTLGRTGANVRLGNVHLVSAKRGWWTRQVKTDIWERGGGNWLVGKANVGKSSIFEVIYPKGTNEGMPDFQSVREKAKKEDVQAALSAAERAKVQLMDEHEHIGVTNFKPVDMEVSFADKTATAVDERDQDFYDTTSLLPPPQQPVNYPVMPIISDLPGTTASPIRIPFGAGKGELIDLPGMERLSLEPYVKPEYHLSIVMKRRVVPERIVLKPGSSLVLGGGLIRITPKTPDLVFMAHAFVPMSAHLTSTAKAVDLQEGRRELNIPSIIREEQRESVKTAGTFQLSSNVTKKYAGPLTRKGDVGLLASRLPFVVWATDILIEGVGWVEVVAQVRKPKRVDDFESWHDDRAFDKKENEGEDQEPNAMWSPMDAAPTPPSTETLSESNSVKDQAALSNASAGAKPKGMKKGKDKHPLEFSPEELAKTMPEIEVFSPEGKFISQRPSLSCWLLGGPLDKKKAGRPRKSMSGAKKRAKAKD
ncbi:uncharacterized protein PV09_07452 [Verruconis gallopava]|uniref:Genetic interactor of prohibitins 3, mitochondrial n=1 Tax=Verruconis gallopava TaxID=253628 RepID=A0A0D1YJX6_9PEZI|nr:uncharacterized protein PV09_07452 [Verruconis gallopava]KIW01167.1 hypothetical protein PV09_07452 [Verruconis gallopava]